MFYAVNKRTKEHRICEPNAGYDISVWRLVQTDSDGGIPWSGGECPLPNEADVEYKMRRGGSRYYHTLRAERACWEHTGGDSDIIAYRPVLDAKPEPEWDGEGWPPVGWCGEYKPYWHACEIVAYHKGFAVVWDAHDLEYFRTKNASIFCPIPSEEDRAVEEMVPILRDATKQLGSAKAKTAARALHRAGYRKV